MLAPILSRLHLADLGSPGFYRAAAAEQEREFVPYQRAASHLELSVGTADNTASSIRYICAIAASMGRFNRGVLRREMSASLSDGLARLMAPSDEASVISHQSSVISHQ